MATETEERAVEEMGNKILEYVKSYQPVTFNELIRHLGDEAQGYCKLSLPRYENIWLWCDVSSFFVGAFLSVADQLLVEPCRFIVYSMSGTILTLPTATRLGHAEPHWLPSMLRIRAEGMCTEEHEKQIVEAMRKNEQLEAGRKQREAQREALRTKMSSEGSMNRTPSRVPSGADNPAKAGKDVNNDNDEI